jgi:PAS domain S-box-containing protein
MRETTISLRGTPEFRAGHLRGLLLPLLLVLLTLATLLGIGTAYLTLRNEERQDVQENLTVIARYKAEQIAEWLEERRMLLDGLAQSPTLLAAVREMPASAAQRARIEALLEQMRSTYGFQSLLLLRPSGEVIFAAGSPTPPPDAARLAEHARAPGVQLHDFHLLPNGAANASIAIGLFNAVGPTKPEPRLQLLLYARIDPQRFLYPLIQDWPTASFSGETLLVRREGDQAVYLNALRHRSGTALRLALPLRDPALPAAQALRGHTGMVEGLDYRGVPVLAVRMQLADTPWAMVAKIDRSDAYASVRRISVLAALAMAALVLTAGLMLRFWWRQQTEAQRGARLQSDLQKQRLAERFDFLSRYANDAILLADAEGRILEVNDRALALYGYGREAFLGLSLADLRAPGEAEHLARISEQLAEHASLVYEVMHCRRDGESFPVECSIRRLEHQGEVLYQEIVRDISERKRAEEALVRSRTMLAEAEALSHTGAWEWDVASNRWTFSDEWLAIHGVSEPALMPNELLDIAHPDDCACIRQALEECRFGRASYDTEHRILCRNTGEERIVRARGRFVRDAHGDVTKVYGFAQDITDRVRAETALRESEQRYRELVQSANSAIIRWTRDGTLTYFNRYAERLFGWRADEAVGRDVGILLPEQDSAGAGLGDLVDAIVRSPKDFESSINENVCRDGRRIWINWTNRALFDAEGQVTEILAIGNDITAQKRAEAALRDADRRKDDFLATLAHELRNPLAPLRNAAAILSRIGSTDPRVQKTCEIIDRQITHMVRLIDDLLDLSRISRGKLQLRMERVELRPILEGAVELARPLTERAGQSLDVSLPAASVILHADPVRLAQVFSNLLINASKFTPHGGLIRLAAEMAEGEALVIVEDTGIGIPAEHLPYLFEMFHQVPSAAERSTSGLGLGLALVRGLIQMHGGRVEARSDGPGKGSVFVVWMPAEAAPSLLQLADAGTQDQRLRRTSA